MSELVVVSGAELERLRRDVWLGRLVRLVVLPMLVGAGGVWLVAATVGALPAVTVAVVVAGGFLAWESVGPGGRARREMLAALDEAVARLQFDARTAAPTPRPDGPGKAGS